MGSKTARVSFSVRESLSSMGTFGRESMTGRLLGLIRKGVLRGVSVVLGSRMALGSGLILMGRCGRAPTKRERE